MAGKIHDLTFKAVRRDMLPVPSSLYLSFIISLFICIYKIKDIHKTS